MAFSRAEWIWRDAPAGIDEYADFLCGFVYSGGECRLRIAADSNYTAYINGRLAAFGQYADYPHFKVNDDVDVTAFVRPGNNRLLVTVWHYGQSSQTYLAGTAGLIFEVIDGAGVAAASSEDTLSRLSRDYVSGYARNISTQLGFTYYYDMTGDDAYRSGGTDGFKKSRIAEGISKEFTPRPVSKLLLEDRLPAVPVRVGSYKYSDISAPPQRRMQDAELSDEDFYPADKCGGVGSKRPLNGGFRRLGDISTPLLSADKPLVITRSSGYDGVYAIVDLGTETSGFLDVEFEVEDEKEATGDIGGSYIVDIGYGEHLADGRCRTAVRNFSAQLKCRTGPSMYLNTFRRFGCRFVQLFAPVERIKISYLGIRQVSYPLHINHYKGENELRRRIWDISVNTLRQCMHEHYEDTPWREQALYTMDSRNQMLSGYYAFGEYRFPRANLVLISKGVREDGLLSLCYPAGIDYPIPAFSLVWFLQVWEYILHSGDTALADELYSVLEKLIELFISRVDESGLVLSFPGCWNFYEWSEGMSGKMKEDSPAYEAPLNAFLSLALSAMAEISKATAKVAAAERYRKIKIQINSALFRRFYNPESLLFESFDNRGQGRYSVLTNALCLLSGAADEADTSHMLSMIASNGEDDCGYVMIPATLSMNCFRYDALLRANREIYAPIILDEIDRVYGYMLEQGATSTWETIKGEADFKGAGSLCHGWSALPVYYFSILGG